MRLLPRLAVPLVYLVAAILSSAAGNRMSGADCSSVGKASQTAPARPPRIVLVSYEDEYRSHQTLPQFAEQLCQRFGYECVVLLGKPTEGAPGLNDLAAADLLVLYVRRKALPSQQMAALRGYLEAGKPLVALRTSSHAFAVGGNLPAGMDRWPSFDPEVLGGSYHGHCGQGPPTAITPAPQAAGHPILAGVRIDGWTSNASLYKVSPVKQDATVLLWGTWKGVVEPLAWTRTYKNARVFYTSLGHVDDFNSPRFNALLVNAVHWALNRPVPK